ncbi:hypothetical protein Poli38472_008533 [Pythium oligandrum]|uniref:Chromo domain-containing protein n=1 Tax=Pythium oligandrum TaxID=41045 RepID=A0A8K1C3Q6_PYTOL|nr:hypothetical protein Poli38472_008533 [Pythium oligandrum]|eukprot:TMW55885.1 hypothetical protein Poli38472_008533 [Pythium oligandrum]
MAAEIERIVDRKTIRNRVHYLVVWRGFGEENNTWESRMDLVADGYSNVIRAYEEARKQQEDGDGKSSSSSQNRGRSPGRAKSPGRRGRSRSNSTARSSSASRQPRRRSSSKSRESGEKSSRKRSSKQEVATTVETAKVEKTGDNEVLRATLEALEKPVTKKSTTVEVTTKSQGESGVVKKAVALEYEEKTETVTTTSTTVETKVEDKTNKSSAVASDGSIELDTLVAARDLWTKITENNWILWFGSVVVVVASLVASQLLTNVDGASSTPEAAEAAALGLTWIPVFTPIIALLLVFHQRDERASVKWTAIALAWRCAAELLLVVGSTPEEFLQVALIAFGVANAAIAIVLALIIRNKEFERSKKTLVVFLLGAFALLLSDSWMIETNEPARASRVQLMSIAALTVALSPALTATPDED